MQMCIFLFSFLFTVKLIVNLYLKANGDRCFTFTDFDLLFMLLPEISCRLHSVVGLSVHSIRAYVCLYVIIY